MDSNLFLGVLVLVVAIIFFYISKRILKKVKIIEEGPRFSELSEEQRSNLQNSVKIIKTLRFLDVLFGAFGIFLIINSQIQLL